MSTLQTLDFDNSFARLPDSLHSPVPVTPLADPELVIASEDCAALLGLSQIETGPLTDLCSGRQLLDGMQPLAQKYTGHQFGAYNPELGDGRGLLLGEVLGPNRQRWDLHLKGAGKTPYSRMGDGRAVLRSSLREFLASEALYHLGIPTTRALCVVGSSEPVMREQPETAATLLRVARSHIRFGHFEYLYHTQQHDLLAAFCDYVITRHYPHCADAENPAASLFGEVVTSTARLMAHWQAAGFAHGVMNSDNFSICGDTFDYGPFAFMDAFEPGLICNHSDWQGRYAFNRQVQIGLWNLNCLALAMSTLVKRETLVAALKQYEPDFHQHYLALMGAKLGLADTTEQDSALIGELLGLMASDGADYTRTFRALADFDEKSLRSRARDEFRDRDSFDSWCKRYHQRLSQQPLTPAQRHERMLATNPKYVLRNYLAQQAISAAQQGDFSEVKALHAVLRQPFAEQPQNASYAALPPDWGRHMEISCSS